MCKAVVFRHLCGHTTGIEFSVSHAEKCPASRHCYNVTSTWSRCADTQKVDYFGHGYCAGSAECRDVAFKATGWICSSCDHCVLPGTLTCPGCEHRVCDYCRIWRRFGHSAVRK